METTNSQNLTLHVPLLKYISFNVTYLHLKNNPSTNPSINKLYKSIKFNNLIK